MEYVPSQRITLIYVPQMLRQRAGNATRLDAMRTKIYSARMVLAILKIRRILTTKRLIATTAISGLSY